MPVKLNPTLIENVRRPISAAELERRWAETRNSVAKQNKTPDLGGSSTTENVGSAIIATL
jgi:hypothetical protein